MTAGLPGAGLGGLFMILAALVRALIEIELAAAPLLLSAALTTLLVAAKGLALATRPRGRG